jgi:hypothetical protein
MLAESEIRAIAQRVVDLSKSTARVDTGALRRSISYTYVKGIVTFRELYYGQFGKNSELEKNAVKLMPRGVEWRIIYTKFDGGTYEVGRTRQGRATQKSLLPTLTRIGTSAVSALINRIKNRGKKKD